ncbi:type 1 glutamine amidotransferase [Hymenobacter sp. GOD-10R]|uniref:type 1 glutamine amidotransferase n=1 Tax=Hymenobacter sp. GOD-10R TaxID=3093922 RepID=UPI002D778933|nr:GMP synthase [Hymenobacter sp. GOD-10R]WRQ30891.1 GMP synthase [Hymenobacter sp. GOD-10R]
MKPLKVAILDLYNNAPNEGMRCIVQQVRHTQADSPIALAFDVFDVRAKNEIPDLSYDIYLSSGGPGSPFPSEEPWEEPFFALLDGILTWNRTHERKKYLFAICHSFQLLTRHLGIGVLSKRKSTSLGIFPIPKTEAGQEDPFLSTLPNPFYVLDSRDYQVTQPASERIAELGVQILALEKERPHVPLEQALMAIRFTEEVFGTQFHPEADGEGMLRYMQTEEKRQSVIENYGEEKYYQMVELLQDPNAIELTESAILPTFLRTSIQSLLEQQAPAEFSVNS